ncbi:MAG: GntR family transcriptional regulator [Bacteroidota bacterium]
MESPVDKIIRQIRHLISTGQISPGDRLPAERKLAERFGVSRRMDVMEFSRTLNQNQGHF